MIISRVCQSKILSSWSAGSTFEKNGQFFFLGEQVRKKDHLYLANFFCHLLL